ncbi:MAG: saccharopine dehydrogenase NADP-binding domain-containing protein [Candidatus Competibacteraceae bacterium]|jgi:short subunit dehydrogenase-like uncharacterized protein|nr:saccharopine dehydrogenase NADP-binding domain-containing protein [Candidatus Competibacteraceae bacterium]
MKNRRWLIYGANGYTGELIAREAWKRGLDPVLAGRSEAKLLPLARELDCECRFFALDDPTLSVRHLRDIALVLNCAGPFSATSGLLIEACLLSKTHYLDITGEIDVFEYAYEQHKLARNADIILCPGVGFDVLATDCVAACLKAALPDADQLALGFDSSSKLSPGTAKTVIEGLAQGGKIRRDGQIVTVPLAFASRRVDFGNGEKDALTIPWGDIASGYRTTGIANIETYIPSSASMLKILKNLNYLRPLLGWRWVQGVLQRQLSSRLRGPNEEHRRQWPAFVWGEVRNAAGATKTARIRTANGYDVTVFGALAVVQQLLHEPPPGGSYTPSQLMGAEFIATLPGSSALLIG